MKSLKWLTYSLAAMALMAGCAAETAKLGAPPDRYESVQKAAPNVRVIEYNPKINVYFVVDNSLSMLEYQKELARQVNMFVDEFKDNKQIDFRIGVMTTYDSKAAKEYLDPQTGAPTQGLPGRLHPVFVAKADAAGKILVDEHGQPQKEKAYCISRQTPNYLDALRELLVVRQLDKKQGGSELEESFTPVFAAFSDRLAEEPMKSCHRPDAHTMFVFLTDTDDQSNHPDVPIVISPEQLHAHLTKVVGDPARLSYYAVLARIKIPSCHTPETGKNGMYEPALNPDRILRLLSLQTDYNHEIRFDKAMSLCENYGPQLAQIGRDMRRKLLKRIIDIPDVPEENNPKRPFMVTYGLPSQKPEERQKIPRRGERIVTVDPATKKLVEGPEYPVEQTWVYNAETKRITINEGVRLNPVPGASILVDYSPVLASNLINDRVKDISQRK